MSDVHNYNDLWSFVRLSGSQDSRRRCYETYLQGYADNLTEDISSLNISMEENLWESKWSCGPFVVNCQDVGATKGTPTIQKQTPIPSHWREPFESPKVYTCHDSTFKSQDTNILNLRWYRFLSSSVGKLIVHERLSSNHNIYIYIYI